mmetsp:Transcript_22888/g.34358  ORF Transcript_22888/g.34358 Transcript_22888/m.34358 type:complete len:210 (-) Transcript_22888:200-829(-)
MIISSSTRIFASPNRRLLCQTKFALSTLSFASPKTLDEILKTDMITGKTADEVSSLWMGYHADKEDTIGICCKGSEAKLVIERAAGHEFIIQPIFREDGFFNLVSQFQNPRYFLLCLLEDYQQNPSNANPLLTMSVFDDLHDSHGLGLVRGDVINKGISTEEANKVIQNLFEGYVNDDEFESVRSFNKQPEKFDVDDYISCQSQKWKAR